MRSGSARTVDGHGRRGSGLGHRPQRGGGRRGTHGRTDGPAARGPREKGKRINIDESSPCSAPPAPGDIEANGINVIDESDGKGTAAGLFWPLTACDISVLAVS